MAGQARVFVPGCADLLRAVDGTRVGRHLCVGQNVLVCSDTVVRSLTGVRAGKLEAQASLFPTTSNQRSVMLTRQPDCWCRAWLLGRCAAAGRAVHACARAARRSTFTPTPPGCPALPAHSRYCQPR